MFLAAMVLSSIFCGHGGDGSSSRLKVYTRFIFNRMGGGRAVKKKPGNPQVQLHIKKNHYQIVMKFQFSHFGHDICEKQREKKDLLAVNR
ncbi:hypothetical protein DERF_009615 [Dermatophagoides farinae]|uniref:Secreted protein n=1 Tax=Dermatophagoides farinae TaxID=6954 RepID=A0A922HWS4_DERFA|nr:hypothetical protein DERF_009615 [Dermatophagoides farinae]